MFEFDIFKNRINIFARYDDAIILECNNRYVVVVNNDDEWCTTSLREVPFVQLTKLEESDKNDYDFVCTKDGVERYFRIVDTWLDER